VWLGTVFGLTPSGKYYMPFACSNVAGCDACKGTGILPVHRRRRIAGKWVARHRRTMARFDKLFGSEPGIPSLGAAYQPPGHRAAYAYIARQPKRFRMRSLSAPQCTACGGLGSREAYLDQLWHEACEEAFAEAGIGFDCEGEDYFAAEYRDAVPEVPEAEDEDEDEPCNSEAYCMKHGRRPCPDGT
jgi:hypothetical protein